MVEREHLRLEDGSLSSSTGNLMKHIRNSHPTKHAEISMKTVMVVKPDGTNTRTVELPFAQQLKHHIDYVFAVADDTSAMRTKNRDGMMNFVQNLRPGYKMPDARTIKKILDAITETQLKAQMTLINAVKAAAKGGPAFGLQFDLWTKRKVRDAFMSLRLTFVTEDATTKARSYHDMLLKFGHFPKLWHTGRTGDCRLGPACACFRRSRTEGHHPCYPGWCRIRFEGAGDDGGLF